MGTSATRCVVGSLLGLTLSTPQGALAQGEPEGVRLEEVSPMDLLFPVERLKTASLSVQISRWGFSDPGLVLVYGAEEEDGEAEVASEDADSTDAETLVEGIWPSDLPGVPRLELRAGLFLNRQLNPTLSVGYIALKGNAVGRLSQIASEDAAKLWMMPMAATLYYRFDYRWDQLIVPYVGIGADGWAWREETSAAITSGIKWGAHGGGGMLLRLNFMETAGRWTSAGMGWPSDVGFSLEGSYAWVNSFGAEGLDFSGPTVGGGIHFSF